MSFEGQRTPLKAKTKTKSNDMTVPWGIKTCQFQILKHSIRGGFYIRFKVVVLRTVKLIALTSEILNK